MPGVTSTSVGLESDDLAHFEGLPAFPTNVPIAPLLRLSLQELIDGENDVLDRLWNACTELGFFYLDLRGAKEVNCSSSGANGFTNEHDESTSQNEHSNTSNGNGVNHTTTADKELIDGQRYADIAYSLFPISDEFFSLPLEEKKRYDFKDQGSYFGYKGAGAGIVNAAGQKDRNEFYNISKDDYMELSDPLPEPTVLKQHRPLVRSFMKQSHAIILLILRRLNALLRLPAGTLENLHRLNAHSGDQMRWVRSDPQPLQDQREALGAHTDFGSVTLLFNRVGGLQVLLPAGTDPVGAEYVDRTPGLRAENGDVWAYVKPLQGHCIVNLGDAMVKFTAGLLRSNTHRVVNPPGPEQGVITRISLVYFSRPEDEVMLRRLNGGRVDEVAKPANGEQEEVICSKEWVLRRALGRRGVGTWKNSEGTEPKSSGMRS